MFLYSRLKRWSMQRCLAKLKRDLRPQIKEDVTCGKEQRGEKVSVYSAYLGTEHAE